MATRAKEQELTGQENAEEKPTSLALQDETDGRSAVQDRPKKSLSFYFTFGAVLINLFVYALDATTLAVAAPVSDLDLRPNIDFLRSFC
jgi:hypothetical protein